jgi:hypothetical protein
MWLMPIAVEAAGVHDQLYKSSFRGRDINLGVGPGGFVTEVDFQVPEGYDLAGAERMIERVCAQRGLHVAMKGDLKAFPGCVHWHYKIQGQKGTLEITLYPQARRIWAKVQDGRRAPWIDAELPQLRREVEGELQQACPSARR